MFLFLFLNLINSQEYLIFTKMKFVFQGIHKDPRSISNLGKSTGDFTRLLYVQTAVQNFSAEVLLQFYIAPYTSERFAFTVIQYQSSFLHYTFWYLVFSPCITSCAFAFVSQPCSTVFEVIRFLVPFHVSVILKSAQHRMLKRLMLSCKFILSFIFTYLNHVTLIIAICYC